ncbi:hypothetical protein A2480_02580 [Candidatus Uhrbacteria bacterium RIFOXYC2_FULL_47_19]|uniref:Uncharacterized protein n=1 Tax=Candidatus Uhrbacteria bacterium RIFOXYC2_FULL_47_19 TaxID=1802424 RepID=A0A1F7WFF1_9BACT|nr:MAG: hypothetical protein A2480_02580 [Candidatus Uhrbacteria bacterium RIFOXYC2_FULL_47_19]
MRFNLLLLVLSISASACTIVVQAPTTVNRGVYSIDPRVVEQLTMTLSGGSSCEALPVELPIDGRWVRPTEAERALVEHRCRGGQRGGSKLPFLYRNEGGAKLPRPPIGDVEGHEGGAKLPIPHEVPLPPYEIPAFDPELRP